MAPGSQARYRPLNPAAVAAPGAPHEDIWQRVLFGLENVTLNVDNDERLSVTFVTWF